MNSYCSSQPLSTTFLAELQGSPLRDRKHSVLVPDCQGIAEKFGLTAFIDRSTNTKTNDSQSS